MTTLQSCRLIGVPPFPYLRDVLLRVATHPQAQIHQLTPKGWLATFEPTNGQTRKHLASDRGDI